MYTIVMDKYKNLNTTIRTTIFQKESLVDKIQFLIPPQYEDIENLRDYNATLKYVDPNGNFHSEVLACDDETYKNYLRYVLPVDTKLTDVAGTVTARLTFIGFSNDFNDTDVYKLESNSTTIHVNKPDGFNDWINGEDLEAYKAQIAKLSAEMPTDLEVDDKDNLHLIHEGEKIGEGVEILMPSQFDELDDANDGIVDVDHLKDDEELSPHSYAQFYEL